MDYLVYFELAGYVRVRADNPEDAVAQGQAVANQVEREANAISGVNVDTADVDDEPTEV